MKDMKRQQALTGTGIAVLALVVAACSSSPGPGASSTAPATTSSGPAPGATQVWAKTWTPTTQGKPSEVRSLAVSPDSSTLYVSGNGPIIAYDASDGSERWTVSEPSFITSGSALSINQVGSTVFVAGTTGSESNSDYLTIAYIADTGKELWRSTFAGQGKSVDQAQSIAASASIVVVDGTSTDPKTGVDFATVAYDSATGAQLWVARYNGPTGGAEGWFPDGRHSLTVSADGTSAYVTGGSETSKGNTDYVTIAYDMATGLQRWASRYGDESNGQDMATAVTVNGPTVAVTGFSESASTTSDIATVLYDAQTGRQLWQARYNGPANQNEGGAAVAFRPSDGMVFVTGTSEGADLGQEDIVTLGYDTASAAQVWVDRYDGPSGGDDNAADLAVSADGKHVVVVGRSVPQPMRDEFETISYQAVSGKPEWQMSYASTATAMENVASEAHAVAISPDGARIFVGGVSSGGYATVAYAP